MTTVRISWQGQLYEESAEILNDIFNAMGMQAAADKGLIPQEEVDKEVARLEEKYATKGEK
jgi:methylmalonyl-CoA mutase N-terminal domain/subunit